MKPDQERVRTLLTDTVTLLCKNGLQYSKELKVQGLLGITLDNDDVFVVHINEIFNGLLGAQVAVRAEESSVSAIAAADSATSDISLKSRKGIPHKYECPSPSGSSKRKARPPTMNPLAHVKQEHSEDEIVIMDTKSLDSAEFNADEIGEGDREAMRKSYGEMLEAPPAKRRVADSSGSFREKQSGGLLGGIIKDTKDKLGDSDNFDNLEGSSLDDSSSGLGPMTSDGQTAFDNSAGCSAWEGQEIGQGQSECGQDSIFASPVIMNLVQHGLLTNPSGMTTGASPQNVGKPTGRSDANMNKVPWKGPLQKTPLPPSLQQKVPVPYGFPQTKRYRPKSSPNKPWECDYPGCGLRFYEKRTMTRHRRTKHELSETLAGSGFDQSHLGIGMNGSESEIYSDDQNYSNNANLEGYSLSENDFSER